MTGILLVNMGGAESRQEMKTFLANMFRDPNILPFKKFGRTMLSFLISNSRYKKSWKKYELIGGTPIIKDTKLNCTLLQESLTGEFIVRPAFSYSEPKIKTAIKEFHKQGVSRIKVIPQYPQFSITTTGSVKDDISALIEEMPELRVDVVHEFYEHPAFIQFWKKIIENHIAEVGYKNPVLLFSAHSIPEYLIERGDTYAKAIEKSSALIASTTGLRHRFAYQSGMRKGKWLGPDTKATLAEMATAGTNEIVIIPISFIGENLETLFDLDHEIVPFGKDSLKIDNISRTVIPSGNKEYIELLNKLVTENHDA